MASYYELLQVPADASAEAIDKSARWARQAVAHDPDRQRRLAAIDEAYETLRDPARRQEYDGKLADGSVPTVAANGVALIAADAPLQAGERGCSVCGAMPTASYAVVRLAGPLVWRQLNGERLPYCRAHGLRAVADANRFNLTWGWLGVPVNLAFTSVNLYSRRRYSSLAPPSA